MKEEVAKLWTKALQSGEFTQARGRLIRPTNAGGKAHCCLGVLCELAVADGVQVLIYRNASGEYSVAECEGFLPTEVKEWAGMRTDLGKRGGKKWALSKLNDKGADFKRIARIIQKDWKDL